MVAKANQGKMKFIIGNGQNLVEFTYVGNVAQAHLLVTQAAAASLGLKPAACLLIMLQHSAAHVGFPCLVHW